MYALKKNRINSCIEISVKKNTPVKWESALPPVHQHQCSAQGQVLHCKLRHQGCNSAQRQVFHCKLRNLDCSFTRDE